MVNFGGAMAQVVSGRRPTAEGRVRSRCQSMWDLWWTKCQWDRFSPVRFIPSILHYTEKRKKLIIITGLHNQPRGCGAPVASAAGPLKIINFRPLLLYTQGKNLQYPWNRRLRRLQRRSGHLAEESRTREFSACNVVPIPPTQIRFPHMASAKENMR
jgi:hypothetical protein